jgi:Leucine-rich repeat (LRR) protein
MIAKGELERGRGSETMLDVRSNSPSVIETVRSTRPRAIRVRGWEGSLAPLAQAAPDLIRLAVECDLEDVAGISAIPSLERLSIREGLSRIDFARLPNLRQLSVWSAKENYSGLAGARALKTLWITNGGLRDLTPLQVLPQLEDLQVSEAPLKSLAGIAAFGRLQKLVLSQVPLTAIDELAKTPSLRELRLASLPGVRTVEPLGALRELRTLALDSMKKTSGIDVIGVLANLESLSLDGVPLTNTDWLTGLQRLEVVHLANVGPLSSIEFVKRLPRLREFLILSNVDIVDGDTAVLGTLPSLRKVAFFDRKKYTATLAEIREALSRHV